MPNLAFMGSITSEMKGTRVLPFEGQMPLPIETGGMEIEHTFTGNGILLGEGLIQSFTSKARFYEGDSVFVDLQNPFSKNGFYETQNNGVLINIKSGERITWTGHGRGVHTDPLPSSKHMGVRFYRTESVNLTKFNGLIAVVEVVIPKSGKGITENHWQVTF